MTDRLAPVDISTLQERVYSNLRTALYQGRFASGETVTIRGLALALGTSAMPVREALQRLVAEKALVQMPNRSIRVPPFTPQMFAELARIRMTIEGMAAQRAAKIAPKSLVGELQAINAEMQHALASGLADGVLDGNRRFHFTLYEAADMPQLLEIINGLWLRTGPFLGMAYRAGWADVPFAKANKIHLRIIDAVERRDGRKASRELALDIWATARWLKVHHPALLNTDAKHNGERGML